MERVKDHARRLLMWINHRRRAVGQGLVEYALILVLIAVVVVGALSLVGRATTTKLSSVACKVGEAGTGTSTCP